MAILESAYPSLLQGVSQQIPKERLPGQLTSMLNMLADPVTSPRRRPGVQMKYYRTWEDISSDALLGWYTDIAGTKMHVILNTLSGDIVLLDSTLTELAILNGGAYLQASSPDKIRAATVGDEFFLVNTEETPTISGSFGTFDPATGGFFYVVGGSFSRAYTVTVKDSAGEDTVTYTTPSGSSSGDAALATPEYIATQLYNSLVALGKYTVSRTSAYVFIRTTGTNTNLAVNSSTGSAYMIASKYSYVTAAGNLPAQLPSAADGYICRVGDITKPQYYAYNSTQTAWLECGSHGSPTGLSNMPVSISKDKDGWYLDTSNFEGRTSGDDDSNENPRFLEYGITGISTFQNRLVLLSGPMVRMSASNKARRMYRTTVTSVVASDPIEIGSSMNSSAAYVHAVPFNKDLLLFSAAYQALIPSNNAVVTPSNATVMPTSSYAVDTMATPVVVGRTLMYAAPRSEDFFAVMEMIPSPYTDAQYVSQDSTSHLPKYFGGHCRFAASSSVAGMAMFAPSGDKKSLLVHEYQWNGDQKAQQAWHQWTFPYDVAAAYFSEGAICMLFAQNDTLVLGCLDPRTGVLTFASGRKPFLDLYFTATITENTVPIPTWLRTFDPAITSKIALAVSSGNLAGDPIGFTVSGTNLITVRSFPSGTCSAGVPYRSSITPTPPVIRDANEAAISSNKVTILRYIVGTKNSSEFDALVQDVNTTDPSSSEIGTLYWSSNELTPGRARYSTSSQSIVPCRTNADTTVVEFYTEGTGELNITSLEYLIKTHQRYKRR